MLFKTPCGTDQIQKAKICHITTWDQLLSISIITHRFPKASNKRVEIGSFSAFHSGAIGQSKCNPVHLLHTAPQGSITCPTINYQPITGICYPLSM